MLREMLVNSPLSSLINKNILADSSAWSSRNSTFINPSRGSFLEKYTEKSDSTTFRFPQWTKACDLTQSLFPECTEACDLTQSLFPECIEACDLTYSLFPDWTEACDLMHSLFPESTKACDLAYFLKRKTLNHFYRASKSKI